MGVYSHYSASVAGSNVVANESYAGTAGAYKMIEEGSINEHSIFEAIIGRDFCEAYNAIDPSIVSESDLAAVNEATGSGIWAKVVEFVQKVWSKILGILKTIKDKIQSVFIRDGKALVNKYEKQINKKMNDGKFTKMKFKWSKKTDRYDKSGGGVLDLIKQSDLHKELEINFRGAEINEIYSDDDSEYLNSHDVKKIQRASDMNEDTGDKDLIPYSTDKKTELLEDALTKINGGTSTDSKSFQKDYLETVFEDEDEEEGLDSTVLSEIKEALTGAKKEINNINKNEKACNNNFKDCKKKAEAIQKKMNNLNGKEGYGVSSVRANRKASRTITCLNIISSVSGMAFSAVSAATKKYLKQCRSVYIKAATYNQKEAAYESALMLEAVGGVSDYEVEEMFSEM